MSGTSKILSRRDLDFLLFEWLGVEELTARPRFADHSRETFAAVLDLCEKIATDHFAPHNRKADLNEPRLAGDVVQLIPEVKAALDVYREAGLMAPAQDYDLGGMQLPAVVEAGAMCWFRAANISTSAYTFLTTANLNLLAEYGTPEQIETYVRPMAEGRFFGTMCLSEPQAGSSLGDITTRAEPEPDGSYRLSGSKMWISAGDHELADNIVHLVLAKIPGGPPGSKGISLFIAPKRLVEADGSLGERNDIAVVGLNHKMGCRGTTNCLLNFGEGRFRPGGKAGAVGYLVGEPHRGLSYMFHMMNEARIGVGVGAAALGYTGYLKSVAYASERLQGRPPGAGKADGPPVPIIEHADVRRMLLAQKSYVEGGLALGLYCARLVDEQKTGESEADRTRAGLLLEILTPIVKSWPSQWCLEANSLAIQVHGGYGYTRDFDVEQLYRDNRLNAIHEGAHGIQAIDLLGRKAVMEDGAALRALADAVLATADRAIADSDDELASFGDWLRRTIARAQPITRLLHSLDDPRRTLANATLYLEALGHLVIAWLWLDQALATAGREGAFYRGKRHAARYFFRWEAPKAVNQFDLLEALDETPATMEPAYF